MKVQLTNDILLHRVDESNLEVLRGLRNDPSVAEFMAVSGIISKEDQRRWFLQNDPKKSIYFLISRTDKIIGYCLLKHIDSAKNIAEPGIILTDPSLYYSSFGALLTLAFLDFCHRFFDIRYFQGNVLNSNSSALQNYNWFDTEVREEDKSQKILISKIAYTEMERVNKMRSALNRLEGYSEKFFIQAAHMELNHIPVWVESDYVSVSISDD